MKKYINGRIYTVGKAGWENDPASCMVIDDNGTILYVGDIDPPAYRNAEMIDLDGSTVLPGFIDAHVHIPGNSLTKLFEVDLFNAKSKSEIRHSIEDFLIKNPEAEYIYGTGFDMSTIDENGNAPMASWIDDITKEKITVLQSNDMHSVLTNSYTMAKMNLTNSDYTGSGRIHTDEAGNPTGLFTDTWDIEIPKRQYTKEEICLALKYFEEEMLSWGFTAMMAIGPFCKGLSPDILGYFSECNIKIRTNSSVLILPEAADERMKQLELVRKNYDRPDLKITTAKYMIDGVIEGETAALKEDYSDNPGFKGSPVWGYSDLLASFKKAISSGFQIHAHTIGDEAVGMTLQAISEAQKQENNYTLRHVLTHLQLVDKKDYHYFKSNNLIAAIQPFWHYKEPGYYEEIELPALGNERCEQMYPAKSLQDSGAVLTCSGDYPVSPVNNPLIGIQMGITRNAYDSADSTRYLLGSSERLSLSNMIEAYTLNGAYQLHRENEIGSLEAGKSADFIILNKNPFEESSAELYKIQVEATFIKGEKVYTRNNK